MEKETRRLRIAYGFSNCSEREYKKLFGKRNKFVMVTDQKYHGLLTRGLQRNGSFVHCFSGLPINRNVTNKAIIHESDDSEFGVNYHYYTTLNFPIFRQIMVFFGGFFNILFRRKYDAIICDFMSSMNAFGMALAAKIRNIPVVEIVMDLPGLMNTTGEPVQGIYKRIASLADGFIFLTRQMNEVVNRNKKPYIIMEGHVDEALPPIPNEEKWERKEGKKVIIYAGGIHKVFGIENLVDGFIKASIKDSELRIFGDGDYREELEKKCTINYNIKYMGVMDNKEIVWQEQRAALLVNPRPSFPVYTKYSFPSKNMEYMVSGTPVLTTSLPGMPNEYKEYIYIIEDESSDGIANSIKSVLGLDYITREKKAQLARQFVLAQKNNVVQARKIIDFIMHDIKKLC